MEQEDGNLITNEFLLQYHKEESERLFGQRINTCTYKPSRLRYCLTKQKYTSKTKSTHMQFTKQ